MQEMTFIVGRERALAEIWDALGSADVNVEASCTYPTLDGRVVRIVVSDGDADRSRDALLAAGFGAIDRHEVVIADIDNRPGQLGDLAGRLADGGAHLTTLYMAMGDRVVIGSDDLAKVRDLLGVS
jgi:hypothetical protein